MELSFGVLTLIMDYIYFFYEISEKRKKISCFQAKTL